MRYIKPLRLKKRLNKRGIHLDPFALLSLPYIAILVCFILFPMFIIIFYAIADLQGPLIRFSFSAFTQFFQTQVFLKTIAESLYFAILTTLVCLLVGYPSAYFISKMKSKRAQLMILLITAPMWVNMLLRTYAWKQILNLDGPLNTILGFLRLLPNGKPIYFLGTDFAITIGMVYIYLPFMILPIYSILQKIDRSYLEASKDLGAHPIRAFFKVTLPLSMSGVLSGIIMVLLPAATTLVIPQYLGESRTNIGNSIDGFFKASVAQWRLGSALSLILAFIIVIMVWGVRRLERRREL